QRAAVVGAAADAHRLLLEQPQAGERLPRIADLDTRSEPDEPARQRRDAGQVRDDVEGRPLADQQRTRRTEHRRDDVAGPDVVALLVVEIDLHALVDRAVGQHESTQAADDAVLFRLQRRETLERVRDYGVRGLVGF